ncbi:hypothetical protein K2173_009526 [Erythroxylum novogranatense]|uniref:Mitochondrial-processing peptidase subunit alpha n=1 Tax=Erythroxylum novogranatense TaxID=1862640 RepID=A0AAV8U6X6_9ROSI|nr:hypothetical protein K2173_009526 [Erythroxylum novogranatense]
MYRAVSRLRALKGDFGKLGASWYATSSAVAVRTSSPGWFSWLTGEQSSSLPSLDSQLEGVSLPPALPDYVELSKTMSKTLANGLKIASEVSSNPAASIGLYIDCGSIYETPLSSGATHLLERMAFKSTRNRSHLRIVRKWRQSGPMFLKWLNCLLILCVNPIFLDWEINEELKRSKMKLEHSNNPQGLLLEAIHLTGYTGALANPLLATESPLNRLNCDLLEEFVAENYTAPRMVLAASGVEFEQLVSIAEPLLSDLPLVPRPQEPKSLYIGGDYRRKLILRGHYTYTLHMTHVALAFEVPGGWNNDKEAITLTVLQMLMGGGGSFSAGGPGKGMHSRLYLRVLNEYQQLQSFSAFNSIFNNTGLFGIYASTTSNFVAKAVDLAVGELIAIAIPGQVTQGQLNRAKEMTKSAVLMNLESRLVVAEDIGRQFLTYGERKSAEQFLKTLDAITLKDISDFERIVNVPNYDSVSGKFHAK